MSASGCLSIEKAATYSTISAIQWLASFCNINNGINSNNVSRRRRLSCVMAVGNICQCQLNNVMSAIGEIMTMAGCQCIYSDK